MTIQGISTKVISTLGNKESLLPIMVKDGVDSLSITAKGFKSGGVVEGVDRGIDEFGTQAIWIGGIPFYKFLIDKTLYKVAKINPGVDYRVIQNKDYAQWALNNASGKMDKSKIDTLGEKVVSKIKKGAVKNTSQNVKDAISDCLVNNGTKTRNLTVAKFALSTLLTLGTYFGLTKLKHKNTKNNVLKKMNDETLNAKQPLNKQNYSFKSGSNLFDEIDIRNKSSKNNPSFKGKFNQFANALVFNPVHNMKIIDAGITTERLAGSRNKVELAEHGIKEGFFLFFLYGFGPIIEKGINWAADKKLNKPIDLKIDVLMDKNFENALSSGKILADLSKLPQKSASLIEKLDFIKNNPDNILVQSAKKSDIVSTLKNTDIIDTSKFIDVDKVDELAQQLKNIDLKFKNSNQNISEFLNKTKALKIASVTANIAISCFFLGYIIPNAIYKYREWKTGSTNFHVEQDIRNDKNKGVQ